MTKKDDMLMDKQVIYTVELPVKEHGREVVKVAKMKEIENLERYEVFKIV